MICETWFECSFPCPTSLTALRDSRPPHDSTFQIRVVVTTINCYGFRRMTLLQFQRWHTLPQPFRTESRLRAETLCDVISRRTMLWRLTTTIFFEAIFPHCSVVSVSTLYKIIFVSMNCLNCSYLTQTVIIINIWNTYHYCQIVDADNDKLSCCLNSKCSEVNFNVVMQ